MSDDETAYAEFFTRWYPKMLAIGLKAGADRADAEDAAGAVAMSVWRSRPLWASVTCEDAYLRTAVSNELAKVARRQHTRRTRERRWTLTTRWSQQPRSVTDAFDHGRELEAVLQCLTIPSDRQRQVLAGLWRQHDAAEVAAELGLRPATVRSQRRHARRDLAPFLAGEGHEHRRWMRAGQRLHEEFNRGGNRVASPRRVIGDAWTLLRHTGLTPDRGTQVEVLDRDELAHRRRSSPMPTGSPVLAELVDLAARNDLLAVVLDSRYTVLHRGGHRDAMAAADRLGFVDGACWDLEHAGATAVGLARFLGAPVAVNRWEHYFPDQHGMCCAALPVPVADHRHITINLTATSDSLTAVPHAVHRMLHALAVRLRHHIGPQEEPPRPTTGSGRDST